MIYKTLLLGSAITASLLLSGCGSSSTTATDLTSATTGYVVDAAVANLRYDCVADNDMDNLTGTDGAFTCQNMSQVRFRLGNLVLGEISSLPVDGFVFPQDMVGVDRTDIYDANVTAMAQLLQSCDVDNDLTNGIQIDPDVAANFDTNETFNADNNATYLEVAAHYNHRIRTQTEAQAHLDATLQTLLTTGTTATSANMIDVATLPVTTNLSDEVKETIDYMVNEEKLAYDLYSNLYTYHTASGTELFQLQNVAERSETVHDKLVEDLALRYEIEDAAVLPSGEFTLPELQSLYDALYAMGTVSPEEALKAGCMVEVTDINDLNADIALAIENNATDVTTVFTALRDGSYNHYWAFDRGLKNMGVLDGCCAIGTVDGVNYCHPEYPQNTHGARR